MRFSVAFRGLVGVVLALALLRSGAARADEPAATVTSSPAPHPQGRRMGWLGLGVRFGFTELHLTPPASWVSTFNDATGGTSTASDYSLSSTARTLTPTLHLGGGGYFFKLEAPISFAPRFLTYGLGLYPLNFGIYIPQVALFPYGSAGVLTSVVQSRGTWDPATSDKIIGALVQARVAAGLKYFPVHNMAVSFEVGYSPWAGGVLFLPPFDNHDATHTEGGFGSAWDLSLGMEWL
jgi:opacity protein-like surface antigen